MNSSGAAIEPVDYEDPHHKDNYHHNTTSNTGSSCSSTRADDFGFNKSNENSSTDSKHIQNSDLESIAVESDSNPLDSLNASNISLESDKTFESELKHKTAQWNGW